MPQLLDVVEKSLLVFWAYLVLMPSATVTCIKDEDIPPMELTLLYRQRDNMNFPIKLEMDVDAMDCEYIANDNNDINSLIAQDLCWGLTPEGIIMFSTLALFTVSEKNKLHSKLKPVPLNTQLKSDSIASYHKTLMPATGRKYLMQIVNREEKILHNFIVTEVGEDTENPTFVLQLHPNYTISYMRFPVKFFVRRYGEFTRERVVMTDDNGAGEYKFAKFQGIKVYEWSKNAERLNELEVFAREDVDKKYSGTLLGYNALNINFRYVLVDDDEGLDGFFEVETKKDAFILSKSIETLEDSLEGRIYLNVFEPKPLIRTLIQKIIATPVKDHDESKNFAYIFTVKEPRATILNELSSENFLVYAFTVSLEFRKFRYDPLELMNIKHLGDNIYGANPSAADAEEILNCRLNGELVLEHSVGPVLAAGKAPNTVFKIHGVPAQTEEYYSKTGQIFKLSGSRMDPAINIEFEKFEKTYNGRGNVSFGLETKKLSRPPQFQDNTRVLQIHLGDALKFRLVVDIFGTLPKESQELLIKPHNASNRVLPKAVAENVHTTPPPFSFKIFKYDMQETKIVLVESFTVHFVSHDAVNNTLRVKRTLERQNSFAQLMRSASQVFKFESLRKSSGGNQKG